MSNLCQTEFYRKPIFTFLKCSSAADTYIHAPVFFYECIYHYTKRYYHRILKKKRFFLNILINNQ